jgi:hypothetical protein
MYWVDSRRAQERFEGGIVRRFLPIAGLILAGAMAAACSSGPASNGISSESATKIVDSVANAIGSAKSVDISGNIVQSGATMSFGIDTFSNGSFTGSITQDGMTIKLVKIGGTDYINAPAAYYEKQGGGSSAIASELGGKWIDGPDSQFGLGDSFELSALKADIKQPSGKVTKGKTGTVEGQSAQSLNSSGNGTIWVATTGPAYPIELTKQGQKINFGDWNEGSPPTAPAGAKALSTLGTG